VIFGYISICFALLLQPDLVVGLRSVVSGFIRRRQQLLFFLPKDFSLVLWFCCVRSSRGHLSHSRCARVPTQFSLMAPAPAARKSSSCCRPSCRIDFPELELSPQLVRTLVGAAAATKDSLFLMFPTFRCLFRLVFVPSSSSDLLSHSTGRVSRFANFFSRWCSLSSFPPVVRACGHFFSDFVLPLPRKTMPKCTWVTCLQ
jgi:hypothetical protein